MIMDETESCFICLNFIQNLARLNEGQVQKLHFLVPSIKWKETCCICTNCSLELNSAHKFIQQCIESNKLRNIKKVQDDIQTEISSDEAKPQKRVKTHFKFFCEFCEKDFLSRKNLVGHLKRVHEKTVENLKPYRCTICSHHFKRSYALKRHIEHHDGERNYTCAFCGKGFITQGGLARHEKTHSEAKNYNCEFCGKRFRMSGDIRTHKLVVHSDPKTWPYECQYCLKKFPIKSNLDQHKRTHSDERPFSCHLCEKKFRANITLKKHLMAHSNCKNYFCDICKKGYRQKWDLIVHQKNFHKIDVSMKERPKNFVCHICPKAFCTTEKLLRHLCSHTGEMRFLCDLCPKKFPDKYKKKQHMKNVHSVVEN